MLYIILPDANLHNLKNRSVTEIWFCSFDMIRLISIMSKLIRLSGSSMELPVSYTIARLRFG